MNIDLVQEMKAAAADQYKPQKGWSTCAQPIAGMDADIYLDLATQAQPALRTQMTSFCDKQNLSYIIIPHVEFATVYEKGTQTFQSWFKSYCQEHGENPNVHVAIIGPCVKDSESAHRKEALDPADRIKDFGRGLYIFLQGNTPKSARQSVERIGDAIAAVEANIEHGDTVAWKNTLHTPSGNGYRDHKSIWVTHVPDDQLFAKEAILSEIKIEHESVQDINRMTRRFMGIGRSTHGVLPEFFERCAAKDEQARQQRTSSSNYGRIDHRLTPLNDFSRAIYSHVFAKAGLDRFLDPKKRENHKPASTEEVYAAAKKVIDTLGAPFKKELEIIAQYAPKVRSLGLYLEHP